MNLLDVYPLFDLELVKGKGAYIFDKAGKPYLDFYGGHGVISIGHNHPHYIQKINHQLSQLGFYSNSVHNQLQTDLADQLGKVSNCENYQLFLCNSGAEANENALKLASFLNQKSKVVAFKGSFHGRTSLALAVTDNSAISAPIHKNNTTTFLDFGDLSALEKTLSKGNISAVIIEGIQGVGGVQIPSKAFMQALRYYTQKYNCLLIVDEIQSGYGRTGHFFAHQYADVQPDIITVAKGMGNGFPIAAMLVHPNLKAQKGMLGTTFGGNHLACAAGLAVLDVIEQEQLIQNANQQGAYLLEQLSSLEGIKEIRGKGLMIGIEFEQSIVDLRQQLLFDYGIFTGISKKTILRLLPPLTISKNEIDLFLTQFKQALQEFTKTYYKTNC
ncbi:aspartate aminotransferase family protein [Aureispira anguillae]|uniref:Aspartate aminotransferase family protein n=1 Tax=Aureispira anguillae TaxID=2864201 RepID=A0A915YIP4_9BACT|nr:aspartate aminotransferase family protein [Aureispira anguillae]BDS13918.1 aspartate aminotransferase family protein [Aureispira anguillae]